MEAAHIPWRPIGHLLVERGLLTDEELEHALAHQATTGRRLGEVVVELGFISRPALSRALAAQSGIELMAETGFGTGLRAEIERRHDDDRVRELELRAQIETLTEVLGVRDAEVERLERLAERRTRQVERLLARARGGEPRVEPETLVEPVARTHLVFAQLPERYALAERDGAPPQVGSELELPELTERRLIVATLGGSPFPGDRRRCAFALELHADWADEPPQPAR